MSHQKIIAEWEKNIFKPLYWLEGEEEYFIDKVIDYAEHKILNESEASFNLSVFYGKDAAWADILNACRRYPMFSEKQVVILKEAQQMKEVDKLEPYIEKPLHSTILIVSYKDKKIDGRTKFARLIREKGVLLSTKKLYEDKLPQWTEDMVNAKGMEIKRKALMLLVDHIGNDLNRLENEVDKILVNLGKRKTITEEDIEQFIGISKEFNVFEFQNAIAVKDLSRCMRIIQYFEANPKAAPIQLILPSFYSFFSKLYMIHGLQSHEEKSVAAVIGVHPFFVKDYLLASKQYSFPQIEKAILELHRYNLRSLGIKDGGTEDASLLKEMVYKIISPN
ncbi:MAG TPA: DNA polymerase III subunit delta [Chitinophagaceae bacterium]|nr:DNA polymerase III subunit delta [Chitinophagaceae bacterium]